MIELNLLPEEFRRKEAQKLVLPELPIKKILLIVLPSIVGIQVLLSVVAFGVKIRAQGLKSEIAGMRKKTETITAHKAETAQIRAKLVQVDSQVKRSYYWSKLLNAVSDSMIKGVWLNTLSMAEEPSSAHRVQRQAKAGSKSSAAAVPASTTMLKVLKLNGSVVGKGDETENVGKFIKELKSNSVLSGLFLDVELSDMTQRKIKEFDVYDFVITCVFKEHPVKDHPMAAA